MDIGSIGRNVNTYGNVWQRGCGRAGHNLDDTAFELKKERCRSNSIHGRNTNNGKKVDPKDTVEIEEHEKKSEESTTDTDIVVKPDGSRVLVMTTNIGTMTTSVSLKISNSTEMPNESSEIDVTEEEQDVRSWNESAGRFGENVR